MVETIKNQECIFINCDGASRGNPGNASIGIVIKGEDKKNVLKKYREFIGTATNNVAEYTAVIKSLDLATEYTNKKVVIFSDSELVVNHLNYIYRCKNKNLKILFSDVKLKEKYFKEGVIYTHITRDKNTVADKLANEALDELIK